LKKLIKINSDVFFICERLRQIDESYEVYFNTDLNCFEVHSSAQKQNSFCFKVPYSQLDERTLVYARKTRIENRDNILREIEQNNQMVYEKNIKEQVNMLKEIV